MPTYYPINEALARRAKEMMSFRDYREGSATAEYRSMVDEAAAIAEAQKAKVDPMYHEKIDLLLDTYARKLAENRNQWYEIQTRCPSVLIAGGSNFPTRKKEKQNAADDRNMEEFREIQKLLDHIRGTGMGGISSDDENAVPKLKARLSDLEKLQEHMKAVNAFFKKNQTLDGCPNLSFEEAEKIKTRMARDWRTSPRPFESYALTNNNALIRSTRARIEELEKRQSSHGPEGWKFQGGEVVMNTEENRVQIVFDGKPEADVRAVLKRNGFRWAPSHGAWQRQLNDSGIYPSRSPMRTTTAPLKGWLRLRWETRWQRTAWSKSSTQTFPSSDGWSGNEST